MNHFDLVDFRLFVQIAEVKSLRKGAAEVCLSASAASTRLANLEARSGTKLLMRSSTGMSLTVAGQAFLYHARQILDQIETLNADLEEYAQSMRGHLRIAANPTAIKEYLPGSLRRFLAMRPEVRLDLRELFTGEIVRSVAAGVSDIGIVTGDVGSDRLESIPYREIDLVLVVPLGHRLADQESVTFKQALENDFVVFPDGSPTYSPVMRAAEELSMKMRVRARATTLDSMCGLIEAGIGVGVAPGPSAQRAAETMAIKIVPIADPGAKLAHQICARKFESLPSFARDFVAALQQDNERDQPT